MFYSTLILAAMTLLQAKLSAVCGAAGSGFNAGLMRKAKEYVSASSVLAANAL